MRLALSACVTTVLMSGSVILVAATSDGMPVAQQNALVQARCAVCHNDAHVNGGLSLEHFDAAHPDPSVAAMLVSKIRDGGAIEAAGGTPPGKETENALVTALLAEAAGADKWTVTRTDAATLTAAIVRKVPPGPNAPKRYAGDIGAPDAFRLTVTCNVDTHKGEMQVAWAPGASPKGSVMSAVVDGKEKFTSIAYGSEKMFKGAILTMGTGATILNATLDTSGVSKRAMPWPEQTLAVSNLFQDGMIVFPFGDLPQTARQSLSACFAAR